MTILSIIKKKLTNNHWLLKIYKISMFHLEFYVKLELINKRKNTYIY